MNRDKGGRAVVNVLACLLKHNKNAAVCRAGQMEKLYVFARKFVARQQSARVKVVLKNAEVTTNYERRVDKVAARAHCTSFFVVLTVTAAHVAYCLGAKAGVRQEPRDGGGQHAGRRVRRAGAAAKARHACAGVEQRRGWCKRFRRRRWLCATVNRPARAEPGVPQAARPQQRRVHKNK
jgi:hypothetical protein